VFEDDVFISDYVFEDDVFISDKDTPWHQG